MEQGFSSVASTVALLAVGAIAIVVMLYAIGSTQQRTGFLAVPVDPKNRETAPRPRKSFNSLLPTRTATPTPEKKSQ